MNKIINVLRYIVFIMAFVLLGMANGNVVKADYTAANCGTRGTDYSTWGYGFPIGEEANYTVKCSSKEALQHEIRLDIEFTTHDIELSFCDKKSPSTNCVSHKLRTHSKKSDYMDFVDILIMVSYRFMFLIIMWLLPRW